MTNKEFMQSEINNTTEILIEARKQKCMEIVKQCEQDIKDCERILKDLEYKEVLESELRLEKDKVKYLMKQLKKQDEILKCLDYVDEKSDSIFSYKEKQIVAMLMKEFDEIIEIKKQKYKQDKILEILKPYFSGAVFPSAINFNFSEGEWKSIKEWLNNDK